MAIPNDERREVAARLRDMAACKDYGDYLGTDDFVSTIKRAFRAKVPIPRTDKAYLRTIADLIEPAPERTCHVVSTIRYDYEGGYAGTEYVTKLSCGHKHTDSYGDAPNYCPNCGAKVVE